MFQYEDIETVLSQITFGDQIVTGPQESLSSRVHMYRRQRFIWLYVLGPSIQVACYRLGGSARPSITQRI